VVARSERSSVLTSWTATLLRALDEDRIDVDALLDEVGLDAGIRADPERRIPLSVSTRLWEVAVDATGDRAVSDRAQCETHTLSAGSEALVCGVSADAESPRNVIPRRSSRTGAGHTFDGGLGREALNDRDAIEQVEGDRDRRSCGRRPWREVAQTALDFV
jgi:Arabinose-binding domain of AraC transcription regulator, N-term